jgi:hypothetical protein
MNKTQLTLLFIREGQEQPLAAISVVAEGKLEEVWKKIDELAAAARLQSALVSEADNEAKAVTAEIVDD